MIVFKKEKDLRDFLTEKSGRKLLVGFIPTMGALHAGHRSLIEKAKTDGMFVVCSIFVNPTQFNNKNDFEKYPVAEAQDIALLIGAGCDVLFLPDALEIYPDGAENMRSYDFGYLDSVLEGAQRPGHFKGVGQVVVRLLDIVKPDTLYLGQKDFQQCLVIKKLLELTGMDKETNTVICETMREADGLAMSSRNQRLTEPQRTLAATIYQCLVSIQGKQNTDGFSVVKKECMELLSNKGFKPEYVELAEADNLSLLKDYDKSKLMVALIAANIGEIRLIDNLLVNPSFN